MHTSRPLYEMCSIPAAPSRRSPAASHRRPNPSRPTNAPLHTSRVQRCLILPLYPLFTTASPPPVLQSARKSAPKRQGEVQSLLGGLNFDDAGGQELAGFPLSLSFLHHTLQPILYPRTPSSCYNHACYSQPSPSPSSAPSSHALLDFSPSRRRQGCSETQGGHPVYHRASPTCPRLDLLLHSSSLCSELTIFLRPPLFPPTSHSVSLQVVAECHSTRVV